MWQKAFTRFFSSSSFAKLTEADLAYFRSIMPQQCVQQSDLSPFNTDFTQTFKGQSQLLLRPQTTQQLAQALAHCSKARLAVVPQSGNTGLVGGSVPVYDEIIIHLET